MRNLMIVAFSLISILSFNTYAQEQVIRDSAKIGIITEFTENLKFMDVIYFNESGNGGTYTGISEITVNKVFVSGTVLNEVCLSNLTVKFTHIQNGVEKFNTIELKNAYSKFSCEYLTNKNAVLVAANQGQSSDSPDSHCQRDFLSIVDLVGGSIVKHFTWSKVDLFL